MILEQEKFRDSKRSLAPRCEAPSVTSRQRGVAPLFDPAEWISPRYAVPLIFLVYRDALPAAWCE